MNKARMSEAGRAGLLPCTIITMKLPFPFREEAKLHDSCSWFSLSPLYIFCCSIRAEFQTFTSSLTLSNTIILEFISFRITNPFFFSLSSAKERGSRKEAGIGSCISNTAEKPRASLQATPQ